MIRKKKYRVALMRAAFLTVTIAAISTTGADSFKKEISNGNQAYKQKDFTKAAGHYRSAEIDRPGSPVAAYNLGTALVTGQNYEEAVGKLSEAAAKSKGLDLQKVHYNIGNGLFGAQKYQEAAGAYRKALELNPADRDAKYNFELALRKLQEQKEQPQNQKQKNQKQEEKGGSSDSTRQDQKQPNQQNQQAQDKKGEKKEKPSQPKQQMTKEEAERILAALKDEEAKAKKQKKAQGIPIVGGRDW
jgi:tetratricopeptide (TPR) repeat protein